MEVSGRKSERIFYCDPCNGDGEHNEAGGYCKQCREYMCKPCSKAHRRQTMSKTHDILVDDDMPSSRLPPEHDDPEMTETCDIHTKTKESIKFYCPTHDDVGCGDCIVLTHRTCNVDYIVDVSKDFKDSGGYKDLLTTISTLEQRIKDCEDTMKEVSKTNTGIKREAIENVRKFRVEINAYLDMREQELVAELDKMQGDDEMLIGNRKMEFEDSKKKFAEIKREIESKQDSINQVFISAKRNKAKFEDLEKSFHETQKELESRRRYYKFRPNTVIREIVNANTPLGTLDSRTLDRVNATPCGDIVIRTAEDTSTGYISGIALLAPDKIVLADFNNKAVKMVDTTTGKVISRLQLSSWPWDLTVLPNSEIAVTMCTDNMMRILAVRNARLVEVRKFSLSDGCRGVDFQMGKLAVIYNPSVVEIMDTHGTVSSVVRCDQIDGGNGSLSWTSQGTELFVKCTNNSVSRLSLQGDVRASYSDSNLRNPHAMTMTRDGNLLVCGCDSNNIHLVSEGAKKLRVLVSQQDGLNEPISLCLSEDTGIIYVGCRQKDNLKVYKLQ